MAQRAHCATFVMYAHWPSYRLVHTAIGVSQTAVHSVRLTVQCQTDCTGCQTDCTGHKNNDNYFCTVIYELSGRKGVGS